MNRTFTYRDIAGFLDDLVSNNPAIRPYLPTMDEGPFFLIAPTGTGKTVTVPTKILAQAMRTHASDSPTVWVVEPKIAIAQDLCGHLNASWYRYCQQAGLHHPPIFGCKTSVNHVNMSSPIVFCTTGIFSIYACQKKFRPGIDRVLIDEAHETLETDHAMELGVALCRRDGIRTDFMSASVDESCIEEAFPDLQILRVVTRRHPVLLCNSYLPMEESIVEVIERAFLHYDPNGPYAPPANFVGGNEVICALTEKGRSKCALIIVSTYADQNSDAERVRRELKRARYAKDIVILMLNGETRRSPELLKKFEDDLAAAHLAKKNIVIISTSVVEMGITLKNIDLVVTADEGMVEGADGKIGRGELRRNSLTQRKGRAGRERAGLMVITDNAGASYSRLSKEKLNAPDALKPEGIRFPMTNGPLTKLAYHTAIEEWGGRDLRNKLEELKLPSKMHLNDERVMWLVHERCRLEEIGATADGVLTQEGKMLERWIGRYNPESVIEILRTYTSCGEGGMESLIEPLSRCVLEKLDDELPLPAQVKKDNQGVKRGETAILRDAEVLINRRNDTAAALDIISHMIRSFSPAMTGRCTSQAVLRQAIDESFESEMEVLLLTNRGICAILEAVEEIMELSYDSIRDQAGPEPMTSLVLSYQQRDKSSP